MISMTWPQYLRRECTACGFRVRLSVLQAEALLVLLMRFPGAVSVGDMIEALWPVNEPDHAKSSLHRIIHDLRVKLGGFHIAGRRSFGYSLVQEKHRNDTL